MSLVITLHCICHFAIGHSSSACDQKDGYGVSLSNIVVGLSQPICSVGSQDGYVLKCM